jgi:hypothetical protein
MRRGPRLHAGRTAGGAVRAGAAGGLSWRGLDGMMRARRSRPRPRRRSAGAADRPGAMGADLDASCSCRRSNAARLERPRAAPHRAPAGNPADGVRVVAWTARREGQWLRWQSPPVTTRGEVETPGGGRPVGAEPGDAAAPARWRSPAAGGLADLLFPQRRLDQPAVQRCHAGAGATPRGARPPATAPCRARAWRRCRTACARAAPAAGPGHQRRAARATGCGPRWRRQVFMTARTPGRGRAAGRHAHRDAGGHLGRRRPVAAVAQRREWRRPSAPACRRPGS